ncbi:MAG: bifunctional hydroxymethylpyrimidine kinase/phosphomethylpyrimidine kinase, partial [Thermoplasmata archaeon]
MRAALTIASSDSSGGAGIQTDLKAIASLGVHLCSVITCVTAQNTQRVHSIFPLPVEEIEKQLESVLSDINVSAAKTGMLYSPEIVRAVSKALKKADFPVVVDPVMVATTKSLLSQEGLAEALIKDILPFCELVTPNRTEAEVLSGFRIENERDAESACERIHELGARNVLLKGGHLGEVPVDILFSEGIFQSFEGQRYLEDVHGSGCAFSAFITGNLALGMGLAESVRKSKRMITAGFFDSYEIGKGFRIVQSHWIEDRYLVLRELGSSVEDLKSFLPAELVPEVGMNFGYALPFAIDPGDVVALKARIAKSHEGIYGASCIDFGASEHISRVILTAMRFDHRFRSALNVKFSEDILARFKDAGLGVAEFDRKEEPKGVSTMEWGTERAIL